MKKSAKEKVQSSNRVPVSVSVLVMTSATDKNVVVPTTMKKALPMKSQLRAWHGNNLVSYLSRSFLFLFIFPIPDHGNKVVKALWPQPLYQEARFRQLHKC